MSGRGDAELLARACELAVRSARTGGGPFGAVVTHGDRIVGEGTNDVTRSHDPTAHAELAALRAAGRTLGTHDLSGAVLFASCEPCPMCLTAAWWARVDRIVYAATRADAAAAGFDDAGFADAVRGRTAPPAPAVHLRVPEAHDAFAAWADNPHRTPY